MEIAEDVTVTFPSNTASAESDRLQQECSTLTASRTSLSGTGHSTGLLDTPSSSDTIEENTGISLPTSCSNSADTKHPFSTQSSSVDVLSLDGSQESEATIESNSCKNSQDCPLLHATNSGYRSHASPLLLPSGITAQGSPSSSATGSGDTRTDCELLIASSNSDFKEDDLKQAVAVDVSVNTQPSQKPHVNPPLDCRPKVFPGASRSLSTVSDSETEEMKRTKVALSFECDENFECEVLEGDEEAAKNQWNNCKKNPGHKDFIPIKEFSLDHLPAAYREQVFLKGIKSVAKLTVRLRVGFTSAKRPDRDYFSRYRGKKIKRTGSGFVCTNFSNNSFGGVEVPKGCLSEADEDTGLRVHCEARCNSAAYFEWITNFCKSLDLTSDIPRLKKFINAMQTTFLVHGPNYALENFNKMLEECFEFSLDDVSGDSSDEDSRDLETKYKLAFLGKESFALPHKITSLHNQVNIYREGISCTKKKRLEFMYASYSRCERELKQLKEIYNTLEETLGSIGSSDCLEDADEDDDSNEYADYSFKEAHSVYYEEHFNEEFYFFEDEEDANEEKERGEHEEKDENSTDKSKMFSQTFNVKHPCPCPECAKSNNPKQEGYIITVMTARHVVFDQEEAQNTIVELFCDDETEEGIVKLSVVDVDVYSHVGDFTTLMCVTHDKRLFLKVNAMLVKMTDNVKRMKTESNTPLAVICSHPHGNFKHITVGEWNTRYIHQRFNVLMSLWTSYRYNTATCPGSSGGPVLILGHKDGTLALDSPFHPHHGTDDQGHNKSTRFYSAEAEVKKMCPEAKQRVLKERREFRRKTLEDGERVSKEFFKIRSNLYKYVSNVKSRSQCWKDDFVPNLLYFITLEDAENASGCINDLINITLEERWSLF